MPVLNIKSDPEADDNIYTDILQDELHTSLDNDDDMEHEDSHDIPVQHEGVPDEITKEKLTEDEDCTEKSRILYKKSRRKSSRSKVITQSGNKIVDKEVLDYEPIREGGRVKGQMCKICGHVLQKVANMKAHIRKEHQVATHKCDICSGAFNTRKDLMGHFDQQHRSADGEQYECSICKKMYESRRGLELHSVIHTGNYKYSCNICNKGFLTKQTYQVNRASTG